MKLKYLKLHNMKAKITLLLLLFIIKIEVHAQAPSISSFTPAVGTIGYTIVLKGSGFTGATAVSFGGVAAASFAVVDDATINAVLGTGNSGSVVVTTPRGSSMVAGFSYCTGVTPSVTITATAASIVSNTSVTFTATATNGGRTPGYQWYKNGNTISGATSSTYTSSTLASSDSIWVVLSSSAACTIVSSATSSKIFMFVSDKIITTVAGNGTANWSGDGGVATAASLNGPTGIAFDKAGNLYIAERNNHDVRKVTPSGIITTVVGNGNAVYGGDGGAAIYASINGPTGLAFDKDGNLYIADKGNSRVRKIDANGIITTVAGNGNGDSSLSGDGGLATASRIGYPESIAIDEVGNLFIANYGSDYYNNNANPSIRKVDINGKISTILNNGSSNGSNNPITIDTAGNLYYVYSTSIYKRKTNGETIILAGSSSQYYSNTNDGISSLSMNLYYSFIRGLSIDKLGNIYFTENNYQTIRKVGTNGVINYFVGRSGYSYWGNNSDGNYALNVRLNNPYATAFDAAGNLYFSEEGTNRVRKVAAGVANFTLPLNLSNFSATTINQNIKTIWQTASEQNTSHFNIQRSLDGIAFATIGTISAVGSGANNYSYLDEHPNYGINYYRLQSMDKDGSFVYSKTVSATITDKRYFSIVPNPARDFATINFSKLVENTSVRVYDITGKPLMVNAVPRNSTSYKLNVQSLPNGFYIIHVNTPSANYTEKLLINK
jgi:sugar lactone lactonase YvrE